MVGRLRFVTAKLLAVGHGYAGSSSLWLVRLHSYSGAGCTLLRLGRLQFIAAMPTAVCYGYATCILSRLGRCFLQRLGQLQLKAGPAVLCYGSAGCSLLLLGRLQLVNVRSVASCYG